MRGIRLCPLAPLFSSRAGCFRSSGTCGPRRIPPVRRTATIRSHTPNQGVRHGMALGYRARSMAVASQAKPCSRVHHPLLRGQHSSNENLHCGRTLVVLWIQDSWIILAAGVQWVQRARLTFHPIPHGRQGRCFSHRVEAACLADKKSVQKRLGNKMSG